MDPGFGAYLRDYTDSPAEGVAGREPRKVPFLRRLLGSAPSSRGLSNGNVGPAGHSQPQPGAEADGGLIDALRGSLVVNGLECKLSCSSSKVGLGWEGPEWSKCLWGCASGPQELRPG